MERFTAEAKASLLVPIGRLDLGAIFMGVQARRFANWVDQQVAEWARHNQKSKWGVPS